MITGGCLCGAVGYTAKAPLRPVVACHCTQCRKTSGHYVAATSAPRDALDITGDVQWFSSSETAKRGFCPVCGSNLFWDGGGANLSIFAGTLDGDPDIKMVAHIYCADKGAYYEIADDLPKRDGSDPAFTTWMPA